ncbi:hypothetical protein FPZ54_00770 [Sphingomonas suaedae]|uniref:Protein kinase domain-containing protein n=1 Tax=Sphingomonas suaedae TaxID=2599297 RepID=A0A518RB78_9SPHN|nr:hypothetical protein [Sphingomonas suaedae]QDX24704.1 hypothetical protein FPZ54_00770 [Sphingomonas suaedae]
MAYFIGREPGAARIRLGERLGEGAAGAVHTVRGQKGVAAKLYHPGKGLDALERKIDAMLARPPKLPPVEHEGVAYPQIAWPQGKLYDGQGKFVGFLMPEIDFSRSTSLVNLLQRSSRRAEKLSDYYGYRVLVARNLASVFAQLHGAGHHMIDMKPANLRFYPALSWMAVVDADGFSIAGRNRRLPADQVSDEYIAPESWRRQPAELGEPQDLFGLAVIIFQLLNNGMHPFAGSGDAGQASDLQSRVLAGLYGYGLTKIDGARPGAASIHKTFRRSTRMLFDRAFTTTDDRPTAAEWRDHLDGLVGMLIPCEAKPLEHAHFGSGCGFCAHEARLQSAAQVHREREQRRARRASAQARARRPVPLHGSGVPGVPWPGTIAQSRRANAVPLWQSRPGLAGTAGSRPGSRTAALVAILLPLLALGGAIGGAASFSRQDQRTETDLWNAAFIVDARSMKDVDSDPASMEETANDAGSGPCASLSGWIEKRLCERPQLAAAERQVTAQFERTAARHSGWARQALTDEHLRWLERQGRCVLMPDPDPCLAESYADRLAALEKRDAS